MTPRYEKTSSVVERKIRNSLILVPMKTGPSRLEALYTLNETSGFIWNALAPGTSEDELVSRLVDEYEVDSETARSDIRRILAELTEIGALRPFVREG
jgi:hypothetical protein